ncbi:MAG: hypothetical protein JSW71_11035 [Gemmatimonadota bacterium]|nr:MAG: hypothetical protein JSW71_11035 [Gemmatimonadota bacterium]
MKDERQIIDILRARGGLIVDGSKRRPDELLEMARAAANFRVPLVLRNMEDRTQEQLLAIARAGKGRVLLELDSVREQRSYYAGPYERSRTGPGLS